MDSRVSPTPLRILCQSESGSCASCCGVDNFRDRSDSARHARLQRRTDDVTRAWPDADALREVRDHLLELERPDVLFASVKVCPFAGYVDDGRVGCLIHPTRHPTGADLRDLAVYPREVCAGHFCAPHDWLREREKDVAQCALGLHYGRVVTDAGLVKGVCALVDEALGRSFTRDDVKGARAAFTSLWESLRAWPFSDPNPARFGGFVFTGDDAMERTLPSCLAGTGVVASHATRTVLDGLGTRALDVTEATAALTHLERVVALVAGAIEGRAP